MIDLHLKRVTVGIRNRVPPTIWATLYLLMVVGMIMMGTQIGLSGTRHIGTERRYHRPRHALPVGLGSAQPRVGAVGDDDNGRRVRAEH